MSHMIGDVLQDLAAARRTSLRDQLHELALRDGEEPGEEPSVSGGVLPPTSPPHGPGRTGGQGAPSPGAGGSSSGCASAGTTASGERDKPLTTLHGYRHNASGYDAVRFMLQKQLSNRAARPSAPLAPTPQAGQLAPAVGVGAGAGAGAGVGPGAGCPPGGAADTPGIPGSPASPPCGARWSTNGTGGSPGGTGASTPVRRGSLAGGGGGGGGGSSSFRGRSTSNNGWDGPGTPGSPRAGASRPARVGGAPQPPSPVTRPGPSGDGPAGGWDASPASRGAHVLYVGSARPETPPALAPPPAHPPPALAGAPGTRACGARGAADGAWVGGSAGAAAAGDGDGSPPAARTSGSGAPGTLPRSSSCRTRFAWHPRTTMPMPTPTPAATAPAPFPCYDHHDEALSAPLPCAGSCTPPELPSSPCTSPLPRAESRRAARSSNSGALTRVATLPSRGHSAGLGGDTPVGGGPDGGAMAQRPMPRASGAVPAAAEDDDDAGVGVGAGGAAGEVGADGWGAVQQAAGAGGGAACAGHAGSWAAAAAAVLGGGAEALQEGSRGLGHVLGAGQVGQELGALRQEDSGGECVGSAARYLSQLLSIRTSLKEGATSSGGGREGDKEAGGRASRAAARVSLMGEQDGGGDAAAKGLLPSPSRKGPDALAGSVGPSPHDVLPVSSLRGLGAAHSHADRAVALLREEVAAPKTPVAAMGHQSLRVAAREDARDVHASRWLPNSKGANRTSDASPSGPFLLSSPSRGRAALSLDPTRLDAWGTEGVKSQPSHHPGLYRAESIGAGARALAAGVPGSVSRAVRAGGAVRGGAVAALKDVA